MTSQQFINLVAQNIGTTLLVLALVGVIIWRVARWTGWVDRTLKKIEKYFDPGPDNIVKQIGQEIKDAFESRDFKQKKSPTALTGLGEEIAEAVNAPKIVSHYVDQVSQETAKMNVYEAREYCFTFADDLLPDLKEKHPEDYETIAQVAFERGASVTSILGTIVGITLRDAVLKRHGKTPAQIDKDKPADTPKGGA